MNNSYQLAVESFPCLNPNARSQSESYSFTSTSSQSYSSELINNENINKGEILHEQIPKQKQKKIKKKKKKKRKKYLESKHRNSKKKVFDSNTVRQYLRDPIIDDDIRISYMITKTCLKSEINFVIENVSDKKLQNIRLKWYQNNNIIKKYLLSKQIDQYGYKRRIISIFNDTDAHKFNNNMLQLKVKYKCIDNQWDDNEITYKKSDKFYIKL